ncbi:fructose-1,6-bisphosphatase II [Bhargavaea ginsengi]|uniref:Fructose-1,6-bisphosphatase n=1 Tax=Bhargavaea ginsengi TaxID=426757 RepID=A0A1H6UBA5_9BACL|nr:class II fructose-bisphosphatase [Bhargavaea ginsengi]SEI88856.1 fructose-1,6-bisphosphatase II [Bhargavaea ginsengi]
MIAEKRADSMQALVLDFLRVTEKAAIEALPWVGSGDKMAADASATNEMRKQLNRIEMQGTIVIGEGEIDEAPMLFIGETLGQASSPEIDIAVDPIEGTTPAVNGQNNSLTVIAAAPKGTLLHAPDMYMKKIAVGPKAKGKINLDAPITETLEAVAEANGKQVRELTVMIQDRPRHREVIEEIRSTGARVNLFQDGDVISSVATCIEQANVDLFYGIGGAPEGVLAAVAVRSLGGEVQAKLMPRNEKEKERCSKMGVDTDRVLQHDDLVSTDECLFIATGITDNLLVGGIETMNGKYAVNSMVVTGTDCEVRYMRSIHSMAPDV